MEYLLLCGYSESAAETILSKTRFKRRGLDHEDEDVERNAGAHANSLTLLGRSREEIQKEISKSKRDEFLRKTRLDKRNKDEPRKLDGVDVQGAKSALRTDSKIRDREVSSRSIPDEGGGGFNRTDAVRDSGDAGYKPTTSFGPKKPAIRSADEQVSWQVKTSFAFFLYPIELGACTSTLFQEADRLYNEGAQHWALQNYNQAEAKYRQVRHQRVTYVESKPRQFSCIRSHPCCARLFARTRTMWLRCVLSECCSMMVRIRCSRSCFLF